MRFSKMHGNGNDFIMIEDFDGLLASEQENIAKKLCNRNFGVGADGIVLVRKTEKADAEMVIINSDGSYASMCGNGLRCFVKYVYERGIAVKNPLKILTGDGIKEVTIYIKDEEVDSIVVDMGIPSFDPNSIPALLNKPIINEVITANSKEYAITSLYLGVPHTVVFGKLHDFQIEEGRNLEKHELFPQGTNVNFCEVIDKNNIKVMTWERGAGPTLACGTGNCASAFAAYKLGLTGNEINVHIKGGHLKVKIVGDEVFMIGNATFVFDGIIK